MSGIECDVLLIISLILVRLYIFLICKIENNLWTHLGMEFSLRVQFDANN